MKLASIVFFVIGLSAQTFGQNQEAINVTDGVALSGYDAVAYFKVGKAVKGSPDFQATYRSAKWYFSSAENRDAFTKNPSAYEPQCGGFCAYGVGAKHAKFPVNPETFKITDGKLFLFYNDQSLNTLTLWNKDEDSLVKKISNQWKTLNK